MKRYCTDNGVFLTTGFTELVVSSVAFPCSAALLYKEFYNIVKHLIVVGWLNRQLITCKSCSVWLCVNLTGKASGCVYGNVTTMRFQLCLDDLRGARAGIVYIHTAHIHLLWNRFVCRAAKMQGGKQLIRRGIYKSTMFEEMGFQYIGPIDGHDVGMLTHTLTNLRGEQYAPVFLHVVTKKGRGLKPAEENPGEFHAVSSIDLNHLTDPELSPKDSFSSTFGCALADLGDDEPRLCGITAAMKYGTGLNFFKHRHPGRFFDVGMAEEHAVTFAAGLASQGLLPVVAIYSTFFQRAYDQIIHDVNLMQLDVLFAVDRAGLVPGDGATHQGIYDVAFFSNVNIPIFAPANYAELRYWLTYLVREAHGPRMIRYARGGENPALAALPCTGARYDVLDPVDGARVALVSYGAETEEIIAAKDLLAQHGVQADCVKLTQLYPLPDGVCDTLKQYNTILFAEDTVRTGGIGEQLGFAMQQCGWQGKFLLHAVDNSHLLHANVPELRKDQQLDAAALCADILNALKEKQA